MYENPLILFLSSDFAIIMESIKTRFFLLDYVAILETTSFDEKVFTVELTWYLFVYFAP